MSYAFSRTAPRESGPSADSDYASRFEETREEAIDLLEAEARQRAEKGVAEPVVYKGRLCYREVIDENGERQMVPLVTRRYSDALLMFLLKALRPEKYREHYQAKHTARSTSRHG